MQGLDFSELFAECCSRNKTIERFMDSDTTIAEHLDNLSKIVDNNKQVGSRRASDDLVCIVRDHVSDLFSKEIADDVCEALSYKVMTTADHHGGIFSAQAFQGDLLFGELLKRMGYRGRYTPLFSFSQVELENSTYARGICCYKDVNKRQQLPIQPKKDLNRMVTVTNGFDREMLDRAKVLIKESDACFTDDQQAMLTDVLDRIYGCEEVLLKERYADQISLIANRLSESYFKDDDSRNLVYIEGEAILSKLFVKDLFDEDSMIHQIFYNEKLRKAFNEISSEEGFPLSGLLFRGVDDKGRRVHTELQADGKLLGAGLNGFRTEYSTDINDLKRLVEERKLIPSGFTSAILMFFERGITWLGGYFQSLYLPKWSKLLADAFKLADLQDLASAFEKYDCSGYISGPVYMLNPAGEFLCSTGPLELLEYKIDRDSFERRMNAKMRDAHKMGLFEIYIDLVPAGEKRDGWYKAIAEYLKENYGEFSL